MDVLTLRFGCSHLDDVVVIPGITQGIVISCWIPGIRCCSNRVGFRATHADTYDVDSRYTYVLDSRKTYTIVQIVLDSQHTYGVVQIV